MPLVLDASIAASWHFADERGPQADVVLDALARDTAIVPAHWWFEIRNVLLVGERRGRASEQQTAQFLDRLAVLRIELAEIPDEAAVMSLARRHRLSVYDAAYLELAQRERIGLRTPEPDASFNERNLLAAREAAGPAAADEAFVQGQRMDEAAAVKDARAWVQSLPAAWPMLDEPRRSADVPASTREQR